MRIIIKQTKKITKKVWCRRNAPKSNDLRKIYAVRIFYRLQYSTVYVDSVSKGSGTFYRLDNNSSYLLYSNSCCSPMTSLSAGIKHSDPFNTDIVLHFNTDLVYRCAIAHGLCTTYILLCNSQVRVVHSTSTVT
jgi:hypothetical protein